MPIPLIVPLVLAVAAAAHLFGTDEEETPSSPRATKPTGTSQAKSFHRKPAKAKPATATEEDDMSNRNRAALVEQENARIAAEQEKAAADAAKKKESDDADAALLATAKEKGVKDDSKNA